MQTSSELVNALLRKGSPERVGLHDNPWGDTLKKWLKQGYPSDKKGNAINAVDHLGFDMCNVGGWFDALPLAGVEELVEESDEWVLKKNGAGASLRWWKDKSGTPEHVDFTMTSREIWEKDYRPHLLELNPDRLELEWTPGNLTTRRDQGLWTFYGHMFIWENMRRSLGDVCMYESLLLDPDWLHDYCRVYTDFFKAHYKHLFENAGIPDGIWMYEDLGYKNALFCSPDILKTLIFPYYREMVEFFHSYDVPVVLHTCGLVEPIIDMIVDTGFDGLNPMEVKAGNDPIRIAKKHANDIAFVGGLDARILESGDKDHIRKSVIELVEGMKSAGARYLFGSDHSLSTNVDYDDYMCALEAYREHAEY